MRRTSPGLMVLATRRSPPCSVMIAHSADNETGLARVSYDCLTEATGLSRPKVSAGLNILADLEVIIRTPAGRSSYQLTHYDLSEPWCKMPSKGLYSGDRIPAFCDFNLRKSVELNALKLNFLFAARRGNDNNLANISYDRITDYTGIERGRIKSAISVLAAQGLVHVEHTKSFRSEFGIANAYRLAFIQPRVHMGTFGRGMDEAGL